MCTLFHLVQGSAFHFQCMYAPPHPVKKCVVLCVRGLLCHVDPSIPSNSSTAPFQNIVQCPDVTKLFMMLLEKFHIGIWSSMTELKLIPLLPHILPPDVMKHLSFILARKDCHDYKKYPSCHKMYDTLLRKTASRAVCSKNQILFVDVRPLSMRHNPVGVCYLPYPFVGELHYPNESRVIPNVAFYCIYRSFIPCIGLPLLTSICCVLLDLVRGITSHRSIISVVALEIVCRSDCGCYCYVLV